MYNLKKLAKLNGIILALFEHYLSTDRSYQTFGMAS